MGPRSAVSSGASLPGRPLLLPVFLCACHIGRGAGSLLDEGLCRKGRTSSQALMTLREPTPGTASQLPHTRREAFAPEERV